MPCLWVSLKAIEQHPAKVPCGIPKLLWLYQQAWSRFVVYLKLSCESDGNTAEKHTHLEWGPWAPSPVPDHCFSTSLHTPSQGLREAWAELVCIDLTDICEHQKPVPKLLLVEGYNSPFCRFPRNPTFKRSALYNQLRERFAQITGPVLYECEVAKENESE